MDGEVVYEDLQKTFDHVREKAKYATLECGGDIALSERHSAIGKRPKWIRERCLFMILRGYWDLVMP